MRSRKPKDWFRVVHMRQLQQLQQTLQTVEIKSLHRAMINTSAARSTMHHLLYHRRAVLLELTQLQSFAQRHQLDRVLSRIIVELVRVEKLHQTSHSTRRHVIDHNAVVGCFTKR
jgi:hypothetical protein